MTVGRVIGEVTATVKHEILENEKLLLVRAVKLDGSLHGAPLLALDRAQAGVGDTVLVLDEGNSARMILGASKAPMRTVVVGIVDRVHAPAEGGNRGR